MSPVCPSVPPGAVPADEDLARGSSRATTTVWPPPITAGRRWCRRSRGAVSATPARPRTSPSRCSWACGAAGTATERGAMGAWIVGIARRRIADALSARTRRADLVTSAGTALALADHPGRTHPEAASTVYWSAPSSPGCPHPSGRSSTWPSTRTSPRPRSRNAPACPSARSRATPGGRCDGCAAAWTRSFAPLSAPPPLHIKGK